MATYRCLSCGGIYVDPQPPGFRYFHTCPPLTDHATGLQQPRPNARDENIVEEFDLFDGHVKPAHDQGRVAHVRIRAAGLGRVKLSEDDLLTGADVARIAQLQQMPGGPAPDVPLDA